MKTIVQRMGLLTAVASLLLCCGACTSSNDETATSASEEALEKAKLENIFTRASVREYQKKAVEQEKIETLVRAGMAAPTAMDLRPWHFVVVTDTTVLAKLAAKAPNARMLTSAPLAIVACGNANKAIDGKPFWVQDVSAASENILLAANALGLGAVWTGAYPDSARCAGISEVLSLPDSIVPLNTIVIGYPLTEPQPKDKWNPANVSYNTYGGTL